MTILRFATAAVLAAALTGAAFAEGGAPASEEAAKTAEIEKKAEEAPKKKLPVVKPKPSAKDKRAEEISPEKMRAALIGEIKRVAEERTKGLPPAAARLAEPEVAKWTKAVMELSDEELREAYQKYIAQSADSNAKDSGQETDNPAEKVYPEKMRAALIGEAKRIAGERMKGLSPEDAHQAELEVVERIEAIEKMSDEELRKEFKGYMERNADKPAEAKAAVSPAARRMNRINQMSVEQMRSLLIQWTKQGAAEKRKKASPDEARRIEEGAAKRISEIMQLPEEKLRAAIRQEARQNIRQAAAAKAEKAKQTRKTSGRRANGRRANGSGSGSLIFFQLEHIPAQHAAEMIDPFMPKNTVIAADPRMNLLIFRGPRSAANDAELILKRIDIPAPRLPIHEMEEEAMRRERAEVEEAMRREREAERERMGERDRPDSGAAYSYEMPRQGVPGSVTRSEGKLISKEGEQLKIQMAGSGRIVEAQLPIARIGEVWTVSEKLAKNIEEIQPGDTVLFEWWSAEGTVYIHNIVLHQRDRSQLGGQKDETFLFD